METAPHDVTFLLMQGNQWQADAVVSICNEQKLLSLGLLVSEINETWVKNENKIAAFTAWDHTQNQCRLSKPPGQLCGNS